MQSDPVAERDSDKAEQYPFETADEPDEGGLSLADNALAWMIREADVNNLTYESHLIDNIKASATATLHKSRRKFYRIKRKFFRKIDHGEGKILIHESVRER